jgi:hypothetical protein
MEVFARRTALDPTDPAAPLEAYKDGRRDERRSLEAGGLDHRLVKGELDVAYERGLREGRLTRRTSAAGVLAMTIVAALLVAVCVMVAQYGSFAAAGGAIDRAISSLL